MKEHLPFAMAWWHNLCAGGTDMFGRDTTDKSFGVEKGTMAHAHAKVDAGFEFMQKLGAPSLPGSGRQEYLESIINNILFCN